MKIYNGGCGSYGGCSSSCGSSGGSSNYSGGGRSYHRKQQKAKDFLAPEAKYITSAENQLNLTLDSFNSLFPMEMTDKVAACAFYQGFRLWSAEIPSSTVTYLQALEIKPAAGKYLAVVESRPVTVIATAMPSCGGLESLSGLSASVKDENLDGCWNFGSKAAASECLSSLIRLVQYRQPEVFLDLVAGKLKEQVSSLNIDPKIIPEEIRTFYQL